MAEEKQPFDVDGILGELGKNTPESEPTVPEKPVFKLNLNLDDEYGDYEAPAAPVKPALKKEAEPVRIYEPEPTEVQETDKKKAKKPKKPKQKGQGCLKALIYGTVIVVVSGLLAYFGIVGFLDYAGITRDDLTVDITVPEGASTKQITEILSENGLIEQPFIFRLYARLTGADGKWHPGGFSLKPNMGYSILTETLQTRPERETVKVTIPEGFRLDQIAARLEKNGVCTTKEFYLAIKNGDFSDYDFIAELSAVDKNRLSSRYYRLEGYLYPDTYDFYIGCSGETAVRTFLDNFDARVDTSIRSAMKARGLSMDELVTLASLVQGEAASKGDMLKVSRVLWNRLENKSTYPKLQCDSTRTYIKNLIAADSTIQVNDKAYDTYECDGLPAGAINNPGEDAIRAVVAPSEDSSVKNAYFFATDYSTGITYYSNTFAEHERICRRYGIGSYGG